jgi:hypothetical protein
MTDAYAQAEAAVNAAEQVRAEAARVADRAAQTLLRILHAPTAAAAWSALGTHYHLPATEAGRSARKWRTTAERIAERHAQRAEADVKALAETHDRHRRNLAAVFALPADTPFEDIREYAARTLTRSGERLLASKAHADTSDATARKLAERLAAAEERANAAAIVGTRLMGDAERFEAAWQSARLRAKQAKAREQKANERAERHRNTRREWVALAEKAADRERDRARHARRRASRAEDTIARVRSLLDTHLGPLATAAVRAALDTPEG